MSINSEMETIIQQHLPAQVAGELKDVLTDYEERGNKITSLQRDLETKDNEISRLQGRLTDEHTLKDKIQQADKDRSLLDEKAQALAARELAAETTELSIKLAAAEDKAASFSGFMLNLARNVDYRRSFFGQVPVGTSHTARDQYGNQQDVYRPQVEQISQETITREE